ncbi:hypothetical protein PI126_g16019 [Phytophthora idaei]|nr:hypothetical protein PI126_g16019 [Phytophthora idaei]
MLDLSSERDELESLGNEKVETLEQQLETLPDEHMLFPVEGGHYLGGDCWSICVFGVNATAFLSTFPSPAGTHSAKQRSTSSDASSRWRCRAIRAGGTVSLLRLTRQCSRHVLPAMAPPNGAPPFVRSGRELGRRVCDNYRLELHRATHTFRRMSRRTTAT